MTGCQADYGDDRHCGNCKSLASDLPVQEVIIDRQACQRPERVYHQLSAQGAVAIKFIPHLQPSDARLWGISSARCLRFGLKKMLTASSCRCLRPRCAPGAASRCSMPTIRRGQPARAARLRLCGGGCPQLRLEDGSNALCEGYRQFYSWSAPYMRVLRDLLNQHRSPVELMHLLR